MDLVRRNEDYFGLTPLFETFFNDPFFKNVLNTSRDTWAPRVDFLEQDNQYVVEVEAPGINKDDITISLEEGQLLISGTKNSQREVKNENDHYYRRESYTGTFSRVIRLPQSVDEDNISASMQNGVLVITLPKSIGAVTRKIDIE